MDASDGQIPSLLDQRANPCDFGWDLGGGRSWIVETPVRVRFGKSNVAGRHLRRQRRGRGGVESKVSDLGFPSQGESSRSWPSILVLHSLRPRNQEAKVASLRFVAIDGFPPSLQISKICSFLLVFQCYSRPHQELHWDLRHRSYCSFGSRDRR